MRQMSAAMKDGLNTLATRVFARLGYSARMSRDAKREGWWWFRARAEALRARRRLLGAKSVVFTSPGMAELLPVELPSAGNDEVGGYMAPRVVSPGTAGAFYLHQPNTTLSYPFRPGYSAAGRVLSPSADGPVSTGDRVAVRGAGHTSLATVPADLVHRVPEGVSLEDAAFVQLGVICAQGVRRAAISSGEPVVVVGAGLIGALAARIALAEGSGPVTVIARSREKEATAFAGGATRFLVSGEDEEEIARQEAPVVIEATGDPSALSTAFAAAGEGARVVLLGSSRGVTRGVPAETIRAKRLRLIGAHIDTAAFEASLSGTDVAAEHARAFLEHLAAGRLSVADLVDEVVDPREAGAFYRRLAHTRDLVGARFDWTLLPAHERAGRARFLRLPDLGADGVDMTTRPLRTSRPKRPARTASNDFGGAAGKIRIGLLGCGDIALLNAEAIAAAPNTKLVACYDPVDALAHDIASAHGATACETSDALLERADVDAVLLCLPHHLHLDLGARVASAGKHVIVEKPLANDLASSRALVDAAEQAGVCLSVCFPHRYHPDVVEARRLIADGAVGTVMGMILSFCTDKPPSYWTGGFSGRAQTDWRRSREKAGGGVLIMNLSHYVDLFRHLTGLDADEVTAHLQAEDPSAEVEDTISIAVRYANGAVGAVLGTAVARGMESATELRLWGRDGQLAVEPRPLVYTDRAAPGVRTGRWQSFAGSDRPNIRAEYFRRLAAALAAGEPPEITADDGLAVQAFIEAAYRSAEAGTSVRPGDLLEART